VKTIRELSKQVVLAKAVGLDLNQLVQEVVMGKLSLDIYKEAKAIYPLRRVEVRKTEIRAEPSSAGPAPAATEPVAPQTLS
jgi:small subunit ribosomal protein S3Ae